mmetsp:Transcript_12141/g.14117  ORF Transcript_12141/g.14117 Transcript_12141/m.14117 type:complete len:230 (-) Transcript_12141:1226-1915(-)
MYSTLDCNSHKIILSFLAPIMKYYINTIRTRLAEKGLSKKAPIIVSTVIVSILVFTPIIVKPDYYTKQHSTCAPYCYHNLDEGVYETDTTSTSSSSSCSTPNIWITLPCISGVQNECGSGSMQSPIDFSDATDDDNANNVNKDCIQIQTYEGYGKNNNGDNDSFMSLITHKKGNCTFDDLTSVLKTYTSVQTHLPSHSSSSSDAYCNKPFIQFNNQKNKEHWEYSIIMF